MNLADGILTGFVIFLIIMMIIVAIFGVKDETEYKTYATNYETYIILHEPDGNNVKALDFSQDSEHK